MSNVNNRYIEEELKQSYLDYSMSVIVSRALPDVRDGLKPVHRRILFAMNDMGMTNDKAYKKSARIVGEVLGKYHPHGDTAVYNTMVRMAQDFAFRYQLVDGHGNFGSIDGDSAAAMRYTEAKMTKISNELLDDIDKDTIDFRKNFDDSLDEPIVLPAKLPNLLLNGATGIAVGMATNIPPHNLGEVVDGVLALIENRDITPVELMEYIKGPDFPTGGIIDGEAGIYDAYTTGRGRVRVRGKVETETHKNGRESIIIKEIPYQLNKSSLIEKIANLVKEKRITGISDLRDESDRDGIRVVIELKKGEEPELILNSLYKYTELQNTFGIIMLALVNNVPKVLNLKEILSEYLKHRFEVVTRRTQFTLNKTEKRAHILKGFIIALENIDRVIEIVRGSLDGNSARLSLIDKYGFSEEQAKSILDMKLQRLTGLEREKIDKEHEDLMSLIIELNKILGNEEEIYEIIKDELITIKEKYDDPRRTNIEKERMEIRPEDLIKDESVLVTVTNKGYVKRMELDKYKAQRRGGKGVSTQNTIEDDFVERMEVMSNLDTMMVFTDKGRVFHIKVYQIPESSKQARGRLIGNLIKLKEDEKVREIIKIREFSEDQELLFVTREGIVKKTNLSEYKNINIAGLKAIKVRENDDIIFVGILPVDSKDQVFLSTKLGQAIRFSKDDVRPTGRDTTGVKGISLKKNDNVISALLIGDGSLETILTITENGYGKRTRVDEYPLQSRSGKGVINIRCSDKTGEVVAVKPVKEGEEIMVITSSGIVIRTPIEQISIIGRATQGVKIMRVNEADSEKVVSIASIKEEDAEVAEVIEAQE
ncbi:DNA gyrase subunit A [uncultured Cetobacterium sp.]|uniref:DNA gyrase subunit A n=1 Tax=uncultured Cetobacterium sp. TaxID=527638 RepID=UPI002612332E|nr:DNA gyrase subunit A [uncultured Cetobacterium sp.]